VPWEVSPQVFHRQAYSLGLSERDTGIGISPDEAYEELCRHRELRTLEETGRHVLSESATAAGVVRGPAIAEDEPGREGVPTVEEPERWRQRYQGTVRRLRDAGVRLSEQYFYVRLKVYSKILAWC
jgi:hypothetical protein